MEKWFQSAIDNPWPFMALGLFWWLWKVGKWLGDKLFDDDKGVVSCFVREIRTDSETMKASLVDVAKTNAASLAAFKTDVVIGLRENKDAIEQLERQLVTAIQARPEDEQLFNVLFDENPIPICFVGGDHKFTRINRACEELWSYSAGELSTMTFSEITLEEDISGDIENVERVKAGALSRYRMQKTYIRKDGQHVPAALHVFRYPSTGSFIHFISIIVPL